MRRIGDKESTEVAYVVTSLPAAEAGPERLLELARAHWAIENKLHWVRDVSMSEDRCRVRAGARALAALRNLVLWLIRARGLSVPGSPRELPRGPRRGNRRRHRPDSLNDPAAPCPSP